MEVLRIPAAVLRAADLRAKVFSEAQAAVVALGKAVAVPAHRAALQAAVQVQQVVAPEAVPQAVPAQAEELQAQELPVVQAAADFRTRAARRVVTPPAVRRVAARVGPEAADR